MSERKTVDELFLRFTDAQWKGMDREARLAALQEMENGIAAEQGWPPMQIRIIPDSYMKGHPNTRGYYDGKALHLNPKFFEKPKTGIPGLSGYGGMQALNTLLHEGRHAWQYYVAAHPEIAIDEKVRTLLRMNIVSYISPQADISIYSCQPLELDARRYAKDRFAELARRAIASGHGEASMQKQYSDNLNAEQEWAASVAGSVSIQRLRDIEEQARQAMKEAFPEADLEGVSMFGEVIGMIEHIKGYQGYVDGHPLKLQAETVGEIADAVDTSLDDMEPELRALIDRLRGPDASTDRVREPKDGLRVKLR